MSNSLHIQSYENTLPSNAQADWDATNSSVAGHNWCVKGNDKQLLPMSSVIAASAALPVEPPSLLPARKITYLVGNQDFEDISLSSLSGPSSQTPLHPLISPPSEAPLRSLSSSTSEVSLPLLDSFSNGVSIPFQDDFLSGVSLYSLASSSSAVSSPPQASSSSVISSPPQANPLSELSLTSLVRPSIEFRSDSAYRTQYLARIRESFVRDQIFELPMETPAQVAARFSVLEAGSDLQSPQSIFNRALLDYVREVVADNQKSFIYTQLLKGGVQIKPANPRITTDNMLERIKFSSSALIEDLSGDSLKEDTIRITSGNSGISAGNLFKRIRTALSRSSNNSAGIRIKLVNNEIQVKSKNPVDNVDVYELIKFSVGCKPKYINNIRFNLLKDGVHVEPVNSVISVNRLFNLIKTALPHKSEYLTNMSVELLDGKIYVKPRNLVDRVLYKINALLSEPIEGFSDDDFDLDKLIMDDPSLLARAQQRAGDVGPEARKVKDLFKNIAEDLADRLMGDLLEEMVHELNALDAKRSQ